MPEEMDQKTRLQLFVDDANRKILDLENFLMDMKAERDITLELIGEIPESMYVQCPDHLQIALHELSKIEYWEHKETGKIVYDLSSAENPNDYYKVGFPIDIVISRLRIRIPGRRYTMQQLFKYIQYAKEGRKYYTGYVMPDRVRKRKKYYKDERY